MMKSILLLLAALALTLPASALGKGPSGAEIDGPGTGGGINISGGGESGGTPLGDLTQMGGFFALTFGQEPDPTLASRPSGDLGPKYTITYTVPGPNNELDKLKQDVYPYAPGGPVTYMKPGQQFFGTEETRGGWFKAAPVLKDTLVQAGLPKLSPGGSSSDDSSFLSAELLSAMAGAALLIAAATVIFLRRRERPAAAA
jgi:hypothetical protein